ncbi:hypothetical protein ACPPVT_02695 [Angustibacter sp. McL0619]|uniref:hypothetical protein n=1 Tax=Angustibacter sp. McL0619 TaxID=3415676 RepID=UPI003CF60C4F
MTGSDDAIGDLTVVPTLPGTPRGAIRYWTTGVAVVLAGLLALGGYAGAIPLAAAALAVVVLLAWGWPALVDLPSPRGTTTVLCLGGAACVVSVAAADAEPRLNWLALALAGSVIAEFVHQLLRRDGRPRMVESVSGTIAGLVVLGSLSAVLALLDAPAGAAGVLTWAVSVAVALLAQVAPVSSRIVIAVGAVLAAVVGGLLGLLLDGMTPLAGALTGVICGAVALVVHQLLAVLPAAGRAPGWLALAAAPLATTGMLGYVILRLALG